MSDVIISNTSNNSYFDVFNTDIFSSNQRELNWLEKSDRKLDQENLFQVTDKESDDTK